jgi:hypothetical protein
MKKILVIFLASSLTSGTYAAYLDDWSNNDLCGWMDSTSTPEYIQKEVDKREILCYGGVEVASLPTEVNLSSRMEQFSLHLIQI